MKVFIVHATAGAGHKKAAEALYNCFKEICSADDDIRNIDALDYTNSLFKKAYPEVYIFLVTYLPFLWGAIFHILNNRPLRPFINNIRLFFNMMHGRRLLEHVINEQPDMIICEHFMSAQLMAYLKLNKKIKSLIICGVTDFGVHQFWVNKGIDNYLVACESTKQELLDMGVSSQIIRVTGIPIGRQFAKNGDRNDLRKKLGLDIGKFTVLVTSGGFGVGPIKTIVRKLDEMSADLQMAVVCGKNEQMFDYFKESVFKKNVQANGFVNNMDEFMEVADLIISKSGGLTVSESLAKGLPMLIIKPIPGQETKNAEIIEKYDIGRRLTDVNTVVDCVNDLIKDGQRKLLKMKENAKMLSHPDSAMEICRWAMDRLSEKN